MSFKKVFSFVFLIFSIISIFLLDFSFISLFISVTTFLLCFLFRKNNTRIFLATLIISFFTILTNFIIIFKTNQVSLDPYKDTNILLGSWIFNDYGGMYVFKEDNSYIKYEDDNTKDNYCTGKYEYKYGGISNDREIIKEDDNFYYYNLDLNVGVCYNDDKINDDNKIEKMIFALGKDNNTFLLIDKEKEIVFYLKK